MVIKPRRTRPATWQCAEPSRSPPRTALPTGNKWFWGLNGVQNGPGPFNGFVRTFEDAKVDFAASWGTWLKAAGLSEDTPTAQLKDSDSKSA